METTLQAPARAAEPSRPRATTAAARAVTALCCVHVTFTARAQPRDALR
ncbi:conserved hypothetical protein [Anaeromyxobacter dehalogenans 2CP-1]|uniref:Uncharacterized protein n=1 Tax=Anaeromyxobacter dehalogenans (strain ATCC BAA-258 / DSM 21875 / 2CP-1) TaxID=455488 RepID=B8JE24_ANAD2|nr:conserved hypothetical protein [Anaeromyxobacter dehalogenans 2CP-1]